MPDVLHIRVPVAREYAFSTIRGHAHRAAELQGAFGELRYCGEVADVDGLPDGMVVHAFECDRAPQAEGELNAV